MPELPEVETTLQGIKPYLNGKRIKDVIVRNPKLRWPVPSVELMALTGLKVKRVWRRAKYILIDMGDKTILLHLGMSGSLRVLDWGTQPGKHDHLDIILTGGKTLRLNDPRRFGCCLLSQSSEIDQYKLLVKLGPEPLLDEFDGEYLFRRSRNKSVAIKNFIMDGSVVVGVGNIYASESLFKAGIRPTAPARKVSRAKYTLLADSIKDVLVAAIKAGGTTLNDFTQADGNPGYFAQKLEVYGQSGDACGQCGSPIRSKVIGQRNTFYCAGCQNYP